MNACAKDYLGEIKNETFLNEKAKEFNLTNQVTFFEYLSDEDIKVLFKNCKAIAKILMHHILSFTQS